MAIKEYLDTHEVFNIGDFERAFPGSQSDRNLLSRAVGRGAVARPRRGLYVSKSGRFTHSVADPLEVAAAMTDDAAFCYLTALQLYGVAHDVTYRTHFYTRYEVAGFSYAGQVYKPHQLRNRSVDTQKLFTGSGKAYWVTTREQTLIDCLARPSLAGGPEHLLRAVGAFAYLDIDKVHELASAVNRSTQARLCWLLEVKSEAWGVTDTSLTELSRLLGSGPYYFWSSKPPKDAHWVNRWRLYLPYTEQEMTSWLSP
ncbi:MAG: hypothetical protein LBI99_04430 [Propionibacteriaceae bacterium]|jgi:predicted transcriptional regulator of viral defense system|nr:hypothetical protein [Propionibacteriaceae bacterium]